MEIQKRLSFGRNERKPRNRDDLVGTDKEPEGGLERYNQLIGEG